MIGVKLFCALIGTDTLLAAGQIIGLVQCLGSLSALLVVCDRQILPEIYNRIYKTNSPQAIFIFLELSCVLSRVLF